MSDSSESRLRKPKNSLSYFEVFENGLQPNMTFCRHKIIWQQVYCPDRRLPSKIAKTTAKLAMKM